MYYPILVKLKRQCKSLARRSRSHVARHCDTFPKPHKSSSLASGNLYLLTVRTKQTLNVRWPCEVSLLIRYQVRVVLLALLSREDHVKCFQLLGFFPTSFHSTREQSPVSQRLNPIGAPLPSPPSAPRSNQFQRSLSAHQHARIPFCNPSRAFFQSQCSPQRSLPTS